MVDFMEETSCSAGKRRKRLESPTTMAMAMASLDEHLLTEILSYLPLNDATRFKTVCKEWRRIISSPYFRSLQLRIPPRADVLGFFLGYYHGYYHYCSSPFHLRLTQFPMESCEQGRKQCVDARDGIVVVAVCDGLLLVKSGQGFYAVWNPSNESFERIPPPPTAVHAVHYGIAKVPSSNSYEIFCMDLCASAGATYSSAIGNWRVFRIELPWKKTKVSADLNPVGGAVSARRPLYHWLTDCQMILALDTSRGTWRKMSLPTGVRTGVLTLKRKDVWLGSVDGDLYFVFVSGRAVRLWVLEDYDRVRWKTVLEVEYYRDGEPVFFDGQRIAIADFDRTHIFSFVDADYYNNWRIEERYLRLYDVRNRKWEGPHRLPYYMRHDGYFLPLIKDRTMLGFMNDQGPHGKDQRSDYHEGAKTKRHRRKEETMTELTKRNKRRQE